MNTDDEATPVEQAPLMSQGRSSVLLNSHLIGRVRALVARMSDDDGRDLRGKKVTNTRIITAALEMYLGVIDLAEADPDLDPAAACGEAMRLYQIYLDPATGSTGDLIEFTTRMLEVIATRDIISKE